MIKPTHLAAAALLFAFGGCGIEEVKSGTNPTSSVDNRPQEIRDLVQYPHRDLCPDTGVADSAHCLAKVRTDSQGNTVVQAATAIQGFTPTDLANAYNLPATGGAGITVGIVDAQDNPSAEADLAVYRAQWGLPPCTTANGCFKKVNQSGQQSNYPTADQGWSGEISLDLDMVSAVCPSCHILLVEATSATQANLGTALNTAVSLGATVISNSYGGSETSSDTTYDSEYFNHPGVAITASAGDDGYGVEYPAASPYVTAVGGTSLAKSTSNSRGWVESAWGSSNNANGGTGSGCSKYTTKPGYQTDPSCSKRMVADVSAIADPNTGVAVYDKYGSGGWIVIGGTSVASPLYAATLALTNHVTDALGYSYSHSSDFYDVTTGVNGTCTTAYFCGAKAGYDGPTGNGTPNGSAMLSGGTASSTSTTTTTSTGATSSGTTSSGTTASSTSTSSSSSGTTASSTGTTSSSSSSGTTASSTSSSSSSSGTTGSSGSSGNGSALQNGVPKTDVSGAKSSDTYFTFAVPSSASQVTVTISGGTGDADLYVRFGAEPTLRTFDCRPYVTGNDETCTLQAEAGTYDIMLNGYKKYAGVTLEASYQ